jgi:LemA protein
MRFDSPVPRVAVLFTSDLRESETMRAMTMARPNTVRGARARWLRRAVLLLPLALGACGYNTIQTLDETAAKSQKDIEVQLQRRADLIPNLVNTVKGFAAQESNIFIAVAQAQRGLTGALARPGGANPAELAQANDAMNRALLPMMTLVTSYPQLKSDAQFLKLQDELVGTENRIGTSRKDYNDAVGEYNSYIRKFPAVMTAKVLGSKPREYFEVTDPAKRDAPVVDFNAAPAVAAPAAPAVPAAAKP